MRQNSNNQYRASNATRTNSNINQARPSSGMYHQNPFQRQYPPRSEFQNPFRPQTAVQPSRQVADNSPQPSQIQFNATETEKSQETRTKQFYEGFQTTSHHFNFVDQLISEVSDGTQFYKSKNLTYCHFSGVSEQTNSGKKTIDQICSSQKTNERQVCLDMRCVWDKSHVRVITNGGQEFVVPMQLDVIDIYAIEDGIILKTLHNEDQAFGYDINSKLRDQEANLKSPSDQSMQETPQSKSQGNFGRPQQFSYFSVTEHPLNEVHPLGIAPNVDRIDEIYQSSQNMQNINLALNTPIQILYHSSTIPLLVFHCPHTKKLSFGVLKQMAKKNGVAQARDRQNSGGDLEMADNNQFISQFDLNGGDFGGNHQTQSNLPTDPLIDNPYAHSLLHHSRHPLFELSPSAPCLYIQSLWQITSTTCPDEIHISTNSTLKDCCELIFYVLYKTENQLAFIKFDMLSGKFKAEHVEKDVQSIVRLNLMPYLRNHMRDEIKEDVRTFIKKVWEVDGELGVVTSLIQDEVVVYQGMEVVAKVPVEQLSVGLNPITKGSQIESLSDARDSYLTVKTSILGQHHLQVQGSNRVKLFATDDHIVIEIIHVLRKTIPCSLFLALYRDIIEMLLIKSQETKGLSDFEKVAGLFLSLVNKQGHFCNLHPPIEPPKDSQRPIQVPRQKMDQSFPDPFAELIHTEFSDLDDLFGDDEIENLKKQHPLQAKNTDNKQMQRPKSSSGKFSRSQNMLNPQQNVFELNKVGDSFLNRLRTDPQEFSKHQDDIFKLFHYLYEDMKLDVLSFATHGIMLGKLLTRWILEVGGQTNSLSTSGEVTADEFLNLDNLETDQTFYRALKKIGFVNHYLADFPQLKSLLKGQLKNVYGDMTQATNWLTFKQNGGFVKVDWVPDILKALQSTLQAKESSQPYIVLYERTRKISKAFSIAFSKDLVHNFKEVLPRAQVGQYEPYLQNMHCGAPREGAQKIQPHSNVYEQLLFWLHGEGLDQDQIQNQLPSEVSLPLREALRYCRLNLAQISTTVWPEALYRLIGREDVIKNIKTLEQKEQTIDVDHLFGLSSQGVQAAEEPRPSSTQRQSSDQGGFVEYLISRFSKDSRYKEVVNLLCSSKDMTLKNRYFKPEFDQLEAEAQKEQRKKVLEKLFIGQLSKMVGRGILSFGTLEMLSTEMLHTPRISLVGQIPAISSSIQIEKKEEEIKELMQWPQFHNGAAEAMRIAINLSQSKGKEANFARNWIMQHKPATPRPEHAGFLLSLGLFGMLDCLQNTDIYQHLKSLHDSTTIGILLGKAASKIGSMDLQYTKTLCMHITYLQPPNLHADISLPVQSAAVIGAGLLYKGTRYRQITEMLLAQIGRKPINDRSIEREVYALSSGIALGMVNLGAGQELQTQLGDLNIEERLLRFIEGGKIMELPRSMLQANQNIENQQCSSIREGNQVNVHITAAGGLFALSLIYLQSNNELIASKLQMPETFHQLEYVRPSFLLQKVLARNMILWDSIEATQEWIDSQVPAIVKNIYENDIATTEKKYAQQIGGECFDFATIALCNINITAGAILSLGYKYAGTGNQRAAALIDRFIHKLRKAKIANQMSQNLLHQIYTDQNKNLIDKYTQENCLCMAALAMSIVMAGTGNQDCFKTIRILRKRLETNEHNYGHQMAIGMALGFLFLGSGAFTLGRGKFQIAALMCALYPIFPKDPNENRYHLQATRHFWVLAVESRLVQARDVDTNEFVQTDIVLKHKDGSVSRVKTPALVDENIVELELDNERYFPLKMQLNKGKLLQEKSQSSLEQVIFIKKRKLQDAVNSQQEKPDLQIKDPVYLTTDPEISDLLDEIETLLEDDASKNFLTKTLKQDYASCLQKIKDSTPQKTPSFDKMFYNLFGKISGKENIEQSMILENVLGSGTDGYGILDIQDTCFYTGDLFGKYLQPDSLRTKILQVIAVNEAVSKQERAEFLKEALVMQKSVKTQFTRNFQLETKDQEFFEKMTQKEPIDAEKLCQSIQSLGLVVDSPNGLDTFTIQTCHFLIELFLNHLSEKGQASVVQAYKASILQDQIDQDQTSREITKNLVGIVKSVVDKSCPDQFDESTVKRVMLKSFIQIGQM